LKKFIIRKMLENDMPAVMNLLQKWNMAPIVPNDDVPDPERSSINVKNTFVALDADRLIGVGSYLDISKEIAETASLAVDPECKGMGIGFALQHARLKEMVTRGFEMVRTETDRPETIEWYIRKFGYRVIGRNPKKHDFSLKDINYWTVLELDLSSYHG